MSNLKPMNLKTLDEKFFKNINSYQEVTELAQPYID